MASALEKVRRLLPQLNRYELLLVIQQARELGGISASTERVRKHRLHVSGNASVTLQETRVEALQETPQKRERNVSGNDPSPSRALPLSHAPEAHTVSPNGNELRGSAKQVLEFLNEKTGRHYRLVDTNLKLIEARIRSGSSAQDCKSVIAKKIREWKSDAKMNVFLRPKTLFSALNFENYLGELRRESDVVS